MKIVLLACSVCLATAFAARVYAQQPQGLGQDPAFPNDPEEGAPLAEPRHVRCGMTPADVLVAMRGKPDEKLSPNIWVYWGFHAPFGAHLQKFDSLVVYFSPERVTKFRLVEGKTLRELLADLRRTNAPDQPEMLSEWPGRNELELTVAPRRIGLGMNPADVARAMHGNPDEPLAPDVWVYWRFQVSGDPGPKDPDTLVVFFSQGRVSRYHLVRRNAVLPWLEGRTA